jgi:hypothetical protein
MLDTDASTHDENIIEENAKLKKALENILNYKEILGLPVFNYEFKKYALLVATVALNGESDHTRQLAIELEEMKPVIKYPSAWDMNGLPPLQEDATQQAL